MDESNADGLGIAWIDPRSHIVRWEKGISVDRATELAKSLPLPYILHARFATIGGATPALCHPFEIAPVPSEKLKGRAPRVLFHNGHYGDWRILMDAAKLKTPDASDSTWSDSRGIAAVLSRASVRMLARIDSSRFAVLDAKGKAPLQLFGRWTKEDGIRWSSPLPSDGPSGAPWRHRLEKVRTRAPREPWAHSHLSDEEIAAWDEYVNGLEEDERRYRALFGHGANGS